MPAPEPEEDTTNTATSGCDDPEPMTDPYAEAALKHRGEELMYAAGLGPKPSPKPSYRRPFLQSPGQQNHNHRGEELRSVVQRSVEMLTGTSFTGDD